jgi:dUTP pyrophosphatase
MFFGGFFQLVTMDKIGKFARPLKNADHLRMQVKVINHSANPLPQYQTAGSAGLDLMAEIKEDVSISPGERVLIPTGLYLEMPSDVEAQIRPRSGLAFKHGITVLNSPGTIDSDYRGEVKVLLINHSLQSFVVKPGERIAQMVFARVVQVELTAVEVLSETERGAGGYGHTGK